MILGKAKAMYANKANQGVQSLLPICRQEFSHLQESRAQHVERFLGKTNAITPNVPPPSCLPQFLLLSMTPHGMGDPFGQLGAAVLAVPLPASCAAPASSLVWQCEQLKRR